MVIHQSEFIIVCQYVCLSVGLSSYICRCSLVYFDILLIVSLFLSWSVCLYISIFVLTVCCVCLTVCLSASLSVCPQWVNTKCCPSLLGYHLLFYRADIFSFSFFLTKITDKLILYKNLHNIDNNNNKKEFIVRKVIIDP